VRVIKTQLELAKLDKGMILDMEAIESINSVNIGLRFLPDESPMRLG
jgi:hypothetical protein